MNDSHEFSLKQKPEPTKNMLARLFLIGVTALTGCTSGMTESPSSSVGQSPVITAPSNSTGTPVTVSGYVDTSATTQMK
jgi:hypothetical protein